MILILLMYALFAAEFPIAKFALGYTNAFLLETIRMIIGGTLFLGYYVFGANGKIGIERRDRWLFVQLILFYIYFSYFACGWALQYMSSLKANIMSALVPFVSAFLAYLLLKDRLTFNKLGGMVLGVTGFMTIIIASNEELHFGGLGHISLPEIMMFVSMVSTEYGYFLLKRLFDRGYSIFMVNGLAMLCGGLLSLISGALFFEQQFFHATNMWLVIFCAFVLFLLVNTIDAVLYGVLIRKYSVTFLTFASFLTPVFGVIYGYCMGEQISKAHIIAFCFIFAGLYLFSRADAKTSIAGKTFNFFCI